MFNTIPEDVLTRNSMQPMYDLPFTLESEQSFVVKPNGGTIYVEQQNDNGEWISFDLKFMTGKTITLNPCPGTFRFVPDDGAMVYRKKWPGCFED